tara:strand:+ start:31457 stop:32005 length:549 start_codon:yes stop_codon:yes gene_type:complete
MSKKDKNVENMVEELNSQEEATVDNETTNNENVDALENAQLELQTEKDRYLRLFAEFENYKKRTGRERIELFKTAGQEVMISMLPVLDDFERALKEINKSEDDSLLKGVSLIHNKLVETLKAKGLQVIETNEGDTFDAEIHEAITQIPAPSKKLKGKIIDVVEKGYTLGDKIIRYPKVVIGQ